MNIRPKRCCAPSAFRSPTAIPRSRPMKRSQAPENSADRYGWSKARSTPAAAARGASTNSALATKAACGSPVRSTKSAAFASQMLGATLVTAQTGPAGKQVNRLYIEDGANIDRELYLSALVDRQTSRVSFVLSTEGGVDIEDVAHNAPEKIHSFRGRSGDRHHAPSRPRRRACAGPDRRSRQADREADRRSSTPPSSPRTCRCWRSTR